MARKNTPAAAKAANVTVNTVNTKTQHFTAADVDAFSFAPISKLQKGCKISGKVVSTESIVFEDTFEKDFMGNKNPHLHDDVFAIRINISNGSCIETIVDVRLGYCIDYMNPGAARDKIRGKLGRYLIGIEKQGNKIEADKLNSFKDFRMLLESLDRLDAAIVPFGEVEDMNGKKSPQGYMLTFNPDEIKEVK